MVQCAVFKESDSRDHWEQKLQSQERDKIIISVTRLSVTGQTDWLLKSGECYLHWIWKIEKPSKLKEIRTMRAFLAEAVLQSAKGKGNHYTRQFIYSVVYRTD